MSIAEYENIDIPKIHITDEEASWDPLTAEYSECKIHMSDHQGQIVFIATTAREPVFFNVVIFYSLAHDVVDVRHDDNLATSLSAHIQLRIALWHGQQTIHKRYYLG